MRPRARSHPRWWLVGGGALFGVVAGLVAPATVGCIYHDTCIMVTSAGHDWCRNVALAKRWPVGGSFADAVPIVRPDGGTPRACQCYNDAEHQVFIDEVPACRFDAFLEDLELAARQECQALVPPGNDHNCWTVFGPQAPIIEGHFPGGNGACIGSCEFGGPPLGGSCPSLSPHECATGGGEEESCGSDDDGSTTGDSGVDDTSSETSSEMLADLDAFIACDDHGCEIDERFARSLYADPSPLLGDRARLVYDSDTRRHVFDAVEPGSLFHGLGFRSGDRLESLNGIVIHDLDSALAAYTQLAHVTAVKVRLQRGSQWQDLTYTFVP